MSPAEAIRALPWRLWLLLWLACLVALRLSSHDAALYSVKANGDDLIWFVQQIIGKHTVVSGHSSGGLLAAYVAANGGELVTGAVLEDPPVFST